MRVNVKEMIERLEIQLIHNGKAKSHLVATPTLKAIVKVAKEGEISKSERLLQENSLRYYKEKAKSAEIENKRLRSANKDLERLVKVRG